jgi:Rod binding domain-containing protein
MTTASSLPLGFTGNSSRDLAFSAALNKVSPQAQQKAQKTSRDFEAVFLNSMFEQMTSGLKGDGPFGDTTGTGPWRAMMTDQFARHFAKAGGLGISSEVYRSLIVHQAAATTSSGASS